MKLTQIFMIVCTAASIAACGDGKEKTGIAKFASDSGLDGTYYELEDSCNKATDQSPKEKEGTRFILDGETITVYIEEDGCKLTGVREISRLTESEIDTRYKSHKFEGDCDDEYVNKGDLKDFYVKEGNLLKFTSGASGHCNAFIKE